MRIAVAATAAFGADVLERLAGAHEVAFLLTRPDARRDGGGSSPRRRRRRPPARLGIPVVQPERPELPAGLEAPTVIVCAYGLYIPPALLDRALWLNVHPSLLPRWRGAAPIERAILAGDESTGVTIHRTVAELDAGPIAAQESFEVGELDAGGVYSRCAELAARLLEGVLRDGPHFEPQPKEGVTYAEKIGPADRELDLSDPPGFTRASFYINAIPKTSKATEAVASVFSVIRNCSVPLGISTPGQPNISSTLWRTVSDHKNLRYYFESTRSPSIFWVDLTSLDFKEGASVKRLKLSDGAILAGNAADKFEKAEAFKFLTAEGK